MAVELRRRRAQLASLRRLYQGAPSSRSSGPRSGWCDRAYLGISHFESKLVCKTQCICGAKAQLMHCRQEDRSVGNPARPLPNANNTSGIRASDSERHDYLSFKVCIHVVVRRYRRSAEVAPIHVHRCRSACGTGQCPMSTVTKLA
jgi:hypothetical protein